MKDPIDDPLLRELGRLPRQDLDPAATERIRALGKAALQAPPEQADWAERLEAIWTDFVELPMSAVVIAAYLVWAVNGVAAIHHLEGASVARVSQPQRVLFAGEPPTPPRSRRAAS